jgi:hypothetical protein
MNNLIETKIIFKKLEFHTTWSKKRRGGLRQKETNPFRVQGPCSLAFSRLFPPAIINFKVFSLRRLVGVSFGQGMFRIRFSGSDLISQVISQHPHHYIFESSDCWSSGLISTTGVPSMASIGPTLRKFPFLAKTETRCRPNGLGLSGERVPKKPPSLWRPALRKTRQSQSLRGTALTPFWQSHYPYSPSFDDRKGKILGEGGIISLTDRRVS